MMLSRRMVFRAACVLLLMLFVASCDYRYVPISSRSWLLWENGTWSLLHDYTTPKGMKEGPPGGKVLVTGVVRLAVIDEKNIVGTDASARWFWAKLDSAADEPQFFSSEQEWTDQLKSHGISSVELKDPK